MTTARVAMLALAALGLLAPDAAAYSGGVTGRTNKTGGLGCAGCHGASADTSMTVAITGPNSLLPGEIATYIVTATKASVGTGVRMGLDVAAGDAGSLSVQSGYPTILSGGEIIHNSGAGALRTTTSGTATYQFRYRMPSGATVGSAHTLYAVAALSFSGWRHAGNFTVTAAAPANPTSLNATPQSSSSISLTWAGASPEFLVRRKLVSAPTSPSDGTLVFSGAGTATTATGLAASTQYFFAVWGKAAGAAVYSTASVTANATTSAATVVARYVDAVNGNDSGGTNTCLNVATPCRTISRAMTVASSGAPGDTINVAPGTYNAALGETFPITMKSGVTLVGTSGADATVVDASGANARVFYCSANNSSTLIEGFTITGGFYQSPTNASNASGGALLAENSDNTTIRRNIFLGNEARGGDGTPSGGQAYGGAVYVSSGAVKIVSNVFANNVVRGGHGQDFFGSSTPGGMGGSGTGGGVYAQGSGTVIGNTFYGNSAIGGTGGFSLGPGGYGGDGSFGAFGGFGPTLANNVFRNNSAVAGAGGGGSPVGSTGYSSYGTYYDGSGNTPQNNLIFGSSQTGYSHYPEGTNEVLADPKLHSPGNWRLRYTSPAIAAGNGGVAGAPTTDLDGVTRPNPPAIGAFEASALTPTASGTLSNPPTGTTQAIGAGVSVNFSSFSGGDVSAEFFASGRTGSIPTTNASDYFWTVATTAASLSGDVTFDFTGKGVANPTTVKLLRRAGSGKPWAVVTPVTRSGSTISTGVTGFSDFALGDLQLASTTVVTSSPTTPDAGHPVTLTATVTGTSGTPTGSVTFSEAGTDYGTASLVGGVASVALSGCNEAGNCLHAGSHAITGTYGGDSTFAGSAGLLNVTVVQDDTTTSLVASAGSAIFGSPVTFTATVVCHSGSPTGTVQFKEGATVIGSAPLSANVASFTTSSLSPGPHTITANYVGSVDFLPSTSAGVNVTIVVASLTGSGSIIDFDEDNQSDLTVFHGSGLWYMRNSTNGAVNVMGYGSAAYTRVPGDYDGDGATDVAVYYPPDGLWFVRNSSTGTDTVTGFGGPDYKPVRGDFDGDGKTDLAVFHDPTGLWFIRRSSTGAVDTIGYGSSGYIPVPGDYDGDGITDLAVYHTPSGLWFTRASSTLATTTTGFGGTGYAPVRGDFDGDGKTDRAVFHDASGLWYIKNSSNGTVTTVGYGGSGYIPVPGRYDSDARTDVAVYHEPTGLWFTRSSLTGADTATGFGGPGYSPVN